MKYTYKELTISFAQPKAGVTKEQWISARKASDVLAEAGDAQDEHLNKVWDLLAKEAGKPTEVEKTAKHAKQN